MQKLEIFVLAGEDRFNVVWEFNEEEVREGDSVKEPLLIPSEDSQMLQPFRNVFFVNLLLSGDGLRIINKPAYPLKYLSDHSNHVQNPGSLLKVLAEQLLTFLRSLNNIGGNCHNLSEFEVAFDKVRQIGELKA